LEIVENVKIGSKLFEADGAKPFVVVGIPAFNEESPIAQIIVKAQMFADAVVVCDDGSEDLTAEIAMRLGADVIKHKRNMGYGAALRSLFNRAQELNSDVLVTLDADGQHDPSEIPNVIGPINQGLADLVIGSRFVEGFQSSEMPLYRRFGAKVITKLVNGSSRNGLRDAQSGFRAYNRRALERLRIRESGMGASVEILLESAKNDLRIFEVPGSCKYSKNNGINSSKHPFTHGLSVIMSIVRFIVEQKPLNALGIPGMLSLFVGTAFGVWLLQIYSLTDRIVTNVALASLSFVVIGFFLMSSAITLYAISRVSKKMNSRI